jgi:dTDP-4-dehydrorhamnose 3,5-epimerase
MINGVEFKEVISHNDERGFFRELLKTNSQFVKEGLSQVSYSLVYPGIIKAWHAHKFQTQWNFVLNGLIQVALYDLREDSTTYGETMTFLAGDFHTPNLYKFPNGVAHGYKCINGPMNILYFTSGFYDENDEIRIKHDDENINFDWFKRDIK